MQPFTSGVTHWVFLFRWPNTPGAPTCVRILYVKTWKKYDLALTNYEYTTTVFGFYPSSANLKSTAKAGNLLIPDWLVANSRIICRNLIARNDNCFREVFAISVWIRRKWNRRAFFVSNFQILLAWRFLGSFRGWLQRATKGYCRVIIPSAGLT